MIWRSQETEYTPPIIRRLSIFQQLWSFSLLSLESLYYLLENATVGKQLYGEMRSYYSFVAEGA